MKTISVFGVFVADLCFISNAIPEKGQTILGSQHIIGPGGKGSNQAIAAAKLNGNVNFITKIGKDKNGEMALTLYKELGINTACIIEDENHSTGVAGIMVNEKTGDNAINIIPGAAGTLTHDDIEKNLEHAKKIGMKTAWLINNEYWGKKDSDKNYIDLKIKNLSSFLKEINILKTA